MTHGYAGTSMSDLSKRTRVSPRLITAHFGTKAEIFTQVIQARNSKAFLLALESSLSGSLEEVLLGAAKFA